MNTNNKVTDEQKTSMTKIMAIVGFIAIIALLVWLAVRLVSGAPNAFYSLASIADSIYNLNRSDATLDLTSQKSVVNSGEAFNIQWKQLRSAGSYRFSYNCTDGISIEVRDAQGAIRTLSCDTPLYVNETTNLDLRVASEKNRFTDVTYSLTFIPDNLSQDSVEELGGFTVVNATIPTREESDGLVTNTGEGNNQIEESDETGEPTSTNSDSTTDTTPTTQPTTSPEYEYVYQIPTSDPQGHVDLNISFVAIGTERNNQFVQTGALTVGQKGAIRFSVHNIGSKTSEPWKFIAELPSGLTYQSDTQAPLKPNERSVLTVGFAGINTTGLTRFTVTAETSDDKNLTNNSFTWATNIVE